jgi:hypothetical protein
LKRDPEQIIAPKPVQHQLLIVKIFLFELLQLLFKNTGCSRPSTRASLFNGIFKEIGNMKHFSLRSAEHPQSTWHLLPMYLNLLFFKLFRHTF